MLQTQSEKFIFELSQETFLSLWSHPNPVGKKGKELCDILIFCKPHIIIISVKEITPTDSGDFKTDILRWKKTALEKSFRQLYGAERFLNTITSLKLHDGRVGPSLPPIEERIYHRIAVVIGGEERMPLMWGDMGKGFIHVFDSISAKILITELNTITDFVNYLAEKENFYEDGDFDKLQIIGGEEDILAYYLGNGESLKSENTMTILDEGLWDNYKDSEANQKWKQDISDSYFWDKIIELLTKDFKNDNLVTTTGFNEFELVVRTMAREPRSERIYLSQKFLDFYSNTNIRSRPVASGSGIVYVFLTLDRKEDRKYRRAELIGRCLIVRRYTPESKIIIGIATEKNDRQKGFSLDVAYLYKPHISKEDKENVEKMVHEFGWFKNSFEGT